MHTTSDAAALLLMDRHIEQLKERVGKLRELIVEMVAQGEDTRMQSELFYALLRTLKSMKAMRMEELESLEASCCTGPPPFLQPANVIFPVFSR